MAICWPSAPSSTPPSSPPSPSSGSARLSEHVAEVLPVDVLVPQVAQGALAVECRADDLDALSALAAIGEHKPSRWAVDAERPSWPSWAATATSCCAHAVVADDGSLRPGLPGVKVPTATPSSATPPSVLTRRRVGTAVARHLLATHGGRSSCPDRNWQRSARNWQRRQRFLLAGLPVAARAASWDVARSLPWRGGWWWRQRGRVAGRRRRRGGTRYGHGGQYFELGAEGSRRRGVGRVRGRRRAAAGGAGHDAAAPHVGSSAATVGVVMTFGGFGASYAIAGVARCGPRCAEDGGDPSATQVVHNAAGSLGYTGAMLGMASYGWAGRRRNAGNDGNVRNPGKHAMAVYGLVVVPVVAVLSLFMAADSGARGTEQRIVEVLTFVWM